MQDFALTTLTLLLFLMVTLGYALFFGIGAYFVIAPCYGELSSRTFVEFFQRIDRYMKVRAKSLMLLRLVGSVILLGLLRLHIASEALWLMTLATACGLLSTVIAARGNVPINRVMAGWDANAPQLTGSTFVIVGCGSITSARPWRR